MLERRRVGSDLLRYTQTVIVTLRVVQSVCRSSLYDPLQKRKIREGTERVNDYQRQAN